MAKKKDTPVNEGGLPIVKPNQRYTREVETSFNDEEIIQFGKDLVNLRHEVEELQSEKKAKAKEFKLEIELREDRMKELDAYITNGNGMVPTEVEVFLNMPNTGRKQICRVDNGELIEEVDMTQDELQVRMEFAKSNDEEVF